jgi:hypothetical protein
VSDEDEIGPGLIGVQAHLLQTAPVFLVIQYAGIRRQFL